MATRGLDQEIDRLYQLPLQEFTASRNALARNAGKDGAGIRGLAKPPLVPWAVNQVYWRQRDVYDALVEAATDMRAAHSAVLSGRRGDLRAAGKAHEEAIEAALKAALSILEDAGQPATEATRQSIATTLRALPAADPPGRLTRALQPGGFETLAGIPIRKAPPTRAQQTTPHTGNAASKEATPAGKNRTAAQVREIARAKETVASTERAVRLAEHAARREEFEAARAAREAARAARDVDVARDAVTAAESALAEAERGAAAALRTQQGAERRAREADEALASARSRADAARRKLDDLSR
ncbi:MAG TPA: hypothetical protein VLD67_11900 [Vicinamibacterales bacterium]|nr:hypothetical protein [Vicinamibacterales bacterium]